MIVQIWTDGSCLSNPGPAGWGAVLRYTPPNGETAHREMSGGHPNSTNNQMELRACIEALRALKRPCRVRLTTDSKYVKKGITEWIEKWGQRGWRTSKGDPVKNQKLWRELDELSGKHQIEWVWVKGHSGNRWNEVADQLARAQAERYKEAREGE